MLVAMLLAMLFSMLLSMLCAMLLMQCARIPQYNTPMEGGGTCPHQTKICNGYPDIIDDELVMPGFNDDDEVNDILEHIYPTWPMMLYLIKTYS